eukprot:COSAG01_NODE_11100_length_2008_cov_2.870613_2_plen_65_part_00
MAMYNPSEMQESGWFLQSVLHMYLSPVCTARGGARAQHIFIGHAKTMTLHNHTAETCDRQADNQ